ncbi:Dipeptidyl aminopeptidase/acylaminoacyl peptidase [Pseudoxanthomonas sp. GM95]|uniref:DPP IV N-terminal domain-containing protein n=1 Tax=Pseudoxanthomonas sp. GM95 TaxID=1881043 RepID=UPI0008B93A60|nr:DPP IV N-terminal domain-containing protein [Pseudoxanthomonas sp. GM95]SEL15718.1 Dipeptidyl aminopeptidase/acylaminoacyl peptidase [Pseudoxanthomonas sp. GM95]
MKKFAALLLLAVAGSVQATPTPADYARSLGLRESWRGLTRDVAFPAQWRDDGRFYYRKTVEGGFAFVVRTPGRDAVEPAFDAARLAEALSRASHQAVAPLALPFSHFDYEAEGAQAHSAIRFYMDSDYATWRCTLVDYVCAPMQSSGRPRGFGVVRDLRVAADNTPHRSPDGQWDAYADGFNVVLRKVADGQVITLTSDGRADAFYDPETIAWSPDARHVALYRVTPGFPRLVTRVESSPPDQLQPRVRTQLYPKPGDAVDIERPVLFDVSGRRIAIDDALMTNPYSMSPIQWRADSASFSVQYVQRGFQRMRVVAVDAASGRAHAAVDETAKTFIYADRSFAHDVDGLGKEILWISERDGWRHLYLVDGITGKIKQQLTRGDWVVREVLRVDDVQRRIWFSASGTEAGKDPYDRQLFSVDFDGRHLTRLSKSDADHDIAISGDGRYYVDLYSRPDLAPVMELHTIDGALVQVAERGDLSRLVAAGWKAPETFVANGRDGKTDIWGMVVRPRDYDPHKRYRVIENIYAGPHDAFVPKTFWPFGYHSGGDKQIGMQALADLGFIVVQIDGMGTANRSKAFQDVAWKKLGDSGFPDRIAWHKAMAARDPSYDISRGVGIYGASAGGQSTLGALERHPEFYTVGVAMAGCYDNRMDKISWNEQWMGWPVDDSYARASGVVNAGKLRGDLLLVVGEQDSNVDPASTGQLVDALIKAGKEFDLLAVPSGEHTVGRSTGPIDYVTRRQYDFFVRHLQGGATPRWNALEAIAP